MSIDELKALKEHFHDINLTTSILLSPKEKKAQRMLRWGRVS